MGDFENLYPGEEVKIGDQKVTIYPLRLAQVKKFANSVGKILPQVLGAMDENMNVESDEFTQLLTGSLLPFLFSDVLDILQECCDKDISNLPHWLLPELLDVWVQENFGEGKMLRWLETVKNFASMAAEGSSPSASSS